MQGGGCSSSQPSGEGEVVVPVKGEREGDRRRDNRREGGRGSKGTPLNVPGVGYSDSLCASLLQKTFTVSVMPEKEKLQQSL